MSPRKRFALMVLALENGIATMAHLDPETVGQHAFLDSLALLVRGLRALG
ncbi:hypothetical protein ACWEHA_00390 [Amycolatopsis nivea]